VSAAAVDTVSRAAIAGSADAAGAAPATTISAAPLVWAFSARTETALVSKPAASSTTPSPPVTYLPAWPGSARRSEFEHRAVVVARTPTVLLALACAIANAEAHPTPSRASPLTTCAPSSSSRPGIAGPGMAVELLDAHAAFAPTSSPVTTRSVRTPAGRRRLLRGAVGSPALEGSDVIQPVLFAVMVSLAQPGGRQASIPQRRPRAQMQAFSRFGVAPERACRRLRESHQALRPERTISQRREGQGTGAQAARSRPASVR